MTRVIHTGDTHIGYRQYHSPERREDFLAAFEEVIDDAVRSDVDAVVHAGDLFHNRRPELPDVLGTIDALQPLAAADIPFLAVVGNHDRTRGDQWLDLLGRLGLAERLDRSGRVVGDVTFYGLDYVPPSRREDLELPFEPPSTPWSALVAHGLFTPFPHAEWETEDLLDRSPIEIDALLLGDNHTPGQTEVNGTWVTYCGSTERTSAAEREDRGYNIVRFDEEVVVSRRALSTPRRFEFIDVTLQENEGIDRVLDRVGQHDLEEAVAVITVDGGGGDVTPAEIESYAIDRGALVARVTDRREFDSAPDGPVEVSFADPDRVVEERLRAVGLSEVADGVDALIRRDDLAESRLRESVAERVRERLSSDDLDAFDPPESDGLEAAYGEGDDPVSLDEAPSEGGEGSVDAVEEATSGDEAGPTDGEGELDDEATADGTEPGIAEEVLAAASRVAGGAGDAPSRDAREGGSPTDTAPTAEEDDAAPVTDDDEPDRTVDVDGEVDGELARVEGANDAIEAEGSRSETETAAETEAEDDPDDQTSMEDYL